MRCMPAGRHTMRWRWRYIYIYIGGRGTNASVGWENAYARACVCAYGGGGKGLVSRRGGMKSGYRAEANGIIHPPPPPRDDRRSPPLRIYGPLLLLRHLIIISYPSLYIIYIIYIIHIYTVFTIFATPTGAGSISAAVLTADQRHYYRHHRHYYHLSLCPLPRAASRFYCVFTPGAHYLNVYISFTQLCMCMEKLFFNTCIYTHIGRNHLNITILSFFQ